MAKQEAFQVVTGKGKRSDAQVVGALMIKELAALFGEYERAGHRAEMAIFLGGLTKDRVLETGDGEDPDPGFYDAPIYVSIDRRLAGEVVVVLLHRLVDDIERAIDRTGVFGDAGYTEPPPPDIGDDEIPF
jgi:hypothetical protein